MQEANGEGGNATLAGGVRGIQSPAQDAVWPGQGAFGQGMAMAGSPHPQAGPGHHPAAPAHDPAPARDIDFQAGRNITLGPRRLRRGVLGVLVADADKKGLPMPAFDELLERAVVRYVDEHGNFVDVSRVLITFED